MCVTNVINICVTAPNSFVTKNRVVMFKIYLSNLFRYSVS